MGNCLKTQLKESVDNNKLPKIGEMILEFLPSTGYLYFKWATDGSRYAKVLDANMNVLNTINESNKGISINYAESDSRVAYVIISDWYNLRSIGRNSGQLELRTTAKKFGYCSSFTNLSPLYTPIIKEGTISELPKSLIYYTVSSGNDGLRGSLMDLVPFRSLKEFNAEYSPNIVGGELKDFCEAWYNPSYVFQGSNDLIIKIKSLTFNGTTYTSQRFTIRQNIGQLLVICNGTTLGTYNGSSWSY